MSGSANFEILRKKTNKKKPLRVLYFLTIKECPKLLCVLATEGDRLFQYGIVRWGGRGSGHVLVFMVTGHFGPITISAHVNFGP